MVNTAVYSSIIYHYHLLSVAESAQNQHMAIALGSVIHQYRTDGQVQGIGRRRTSMRTISIRPMDGGPVVEATIVHRREANFKYGIPYLRKANKEIDVFTPAAASSDLQFRSRTGGQPTSHSSFSATPAARPLL